MVRFAFCRFFVHSCCILKDITTAFASESFAEASRLVCWWLAEDCRSRPVGRSIKGLCCESLINQGLCQLELAKAAHFPPRPFKRIYQKWQTASA
jgi:hypothetical protein